LEGAALKLRFCLHCVDIERGQASTSDALSSIISKEVGLEILAPNI